ncbi:MAG: hypothetical protein OXC09_01495, partial [Truepera sp.]|nr:hypothetical protein [Truepera sp.]
RPRCGTPDGSTYQIWGGGGSVDVLELSGVVFQVAVPTRFGGPHISATAVGFRRWIMSGGT